MFKFEKRKNPGKNPFWKRKSRQICTFLAIGNWQKANLKIFVKVILE